MKLRWYIKKDYTDHDGDLIMFEPVLQCYIPVETIDGVVTKYAWFDIPSVYEGQEGENV